MPLAEEARMDPFAMSEPGAAAQRPAYDETQNAEPVRPRRTLAEQADFNARVEAAAHAKRIEAEQAEVDAEAARRHDEREKQLEADKDADEKERAARDAQTAKAAELARHPHTQLRGILDSLRAPTALDINGRLGTLQVAVTRLAQLILQHTPAPPQEDANGEGQHGIDGREPVEGSGEPQSRDTGL
jgi:hypothetical protein